MIIALIGQKQSGKSTAANHLVSKYNFTKINFKDALIEEIRTYFPDFLKAECKLYNCSLEELFEKKPGHIRQLMQNFGTELRRKEDPNYWVAKWVDNNPWKSNTVVDDTRFLNEALVVKNLDGVIIKIIRTGQVNSDLHQSEQEFNQIIPDYTIEVAEGKQVELCEELNVILNKLKI